MTARVLLTGSCGLVGRALARRFEAEGVRVAGLDLRAAGADQGDVCDPASVARALRGCDGVVHLAAVSRVVWGEHDPDLCWRTNVEGLRNVLRCAAASPGRPWLVFASSREVYGAAEGLPATEQCPLRPLNVYGRSKVEGERLVAEARREGVRACTIRLSNVFGDPADHPDRVVPAFARAAAEGKPLRVDGAQVTLDFTHLDDVCRGIAAVTGLLREGGEPPGPIHFVTGTPTSLGELAALAVRVAGTSSVVWRSEPRRFDVERFFGSPARAKELLGWAPEVGLEEGVRRLVSAFRRLAR